MYLKYNDLKSLSDVRGDRLTLTDWLNDFLWIRQVSICGFQMEAELFIQEAKSTTLQ